MLVAAQATPEIDTAFPEAARERDGLVGRAPDPLDGRAIRVWLTPIAIELGPAAADVADDLHARATAALGDRAIHALEHCLAALMQL